MILDLYINTWKKIQICIFLPSIFNAFYFAFLSWHFAAGDVVICRAADGDAALRGFLRAQEDDSQEGATYQAGQQELLWKS